MKMHEGYQIYKKSLKNRLRIVQDRLRRDTQRQKVLFFLEQKKSLRSGGKIWVGRVTRNYFFFCLS